MYLKKTIPRPITYFERPSQYKILSYNNGFVLNTHRWWNYSSCSWATFNTPILFNETLFHFDWKHFWLPLYINEDIGGHNATHTLTHTHTLLQFFSIYLLQSVSASEINTKFAWVRRHISGDILKGIFLKLQLDNGKYY